MSESTPSAKPSLAVRFARLVTAMHVEPGALNEHRKEVRAIAKALKKAPVALACADSVLRDGEILLASDDAADSEALALLAGRCEAYGVEQLTLGAAATEADLFDLVKLLATPPDQADARAFFAARAAAVDARAIPRVLRKQVAAVEESADVAPIVESPSAKKDQATEQELEAIVEAASVPMPKASAETDARSERLSEALAVPTSADPELTALYKELQETTELAALRAPLERIVFLADIAFRTGKFDRMVEVLTALVAIEHAQLEIDASDDRRREFAHAVRRLATPVVLRQLAVLRHLRADDAEETKRLQAVLYRYGTDGAEALIDEWANAPTAEARSICLAALRGLRRTHDALFDSVRDTDTQKVRQAVELLGALGDQRAEQLLLEQIRHPDARTRRSVVSALESFTSASSFDAIGLAALDDDPSVRLRAVSALSKRGAAAVKLLAPLLDDETEREVLYAAIAALGTVGTPEATQVLIRAANGETEHTRKRSPSYRLQACAALALIRSPQAMAAVQLLRDDRDREVREGSMRLVAQASRRGTTALRAVIEQ